MRIERFDPAADTADIGVFYDLLVRCTEVDDPAVPPMSQPVFRSWIEWGWMGSPRECWLAAADGDGGCAGGYVLELPVTENTHQGSLTLLVEPGRRRAGLGSALLRHAAGRAAADGRTVLTGETRQGTAGAGFAAAVGARRGVTEVRRVLDLASVPAGHFDDLRQKAEVAAAGYTLVSWRGPCPDEYTGQVANVINAMADAPHSPGEEPEASSAERVREFDQRRVAMGTRDYSVAARSDATGELAALTQLSIDPHQPDWGYQLVTAVTRPHRGHRLGLLVKAAMLVGLAASEPGLEHIVTGNADANQHMIAINSELGYRVLDEWPNWQIDVADAVTAGQAARS